MLMPPSVSPKSLQTLLLLKRSPETARRQGTRTRQEYLCQYTDVRPSFTHCAFPCSSYSHLSFIITPHCFLVNDSAVFFFFFFAVFFLLLLFLLFIFQYQALFFFLNSAAKCAQNVLSFLRAHSFLAFTD